MQEKHLLYLLKQLPFPVLFISWCIFRFSASVIFLFIEGLSSVYGMMKVCWWMMNSFSFSWSKKVFCLCFWILIFVEFRILAWWKFFSFSVFFLLAYLVFSKKSAVIHIFVPLCVIQTFSLADFKILSSSLLLSNFLKQLQIPSFFGGGS